MKQLYGDIWYHHGERDPDPGNIYVYAKGTIPLWFTHFHKNAKGAPFATRGHIISDGIYSYCDWCKKEFPSRSKLETMVGLKELTE